MKNTHRFLDAVLAATLALAPALLLAPTLAWPQPLQRAVLVMPDTLQSAVTTTTGYAEGGLEIVSADHQVTVSVINSPLNDARRSDRAAEAARLAATVEHEITQRADLADVLVIHVDFLRRKGGAAEAVQGVDFRKTPQGRFTQHVT